MWYKILPVFGATVGSVMIAGYTTNILNRLFLGTPYSRQVNTKEKIDHYYRDLRISGGRGAEYQVGLEGIS